MKNKSVVALLILVTSVAHGERPETGFPETSPTFTKAMNPSLEISTHAVVNTEMTKSPSDVFLTLTRDALSKKNLPSNATSVPVEVLEKFSPKNMGEALNRETSLQMRSFGEHIGAALQFRLRGSTPAQSLVLLDGRPIGGLGFDGADLSEIPLEAVDRIEVVRGGTSALYGSNAIGGVLNIITKRATSVGRPVSHIGAEFGSYGKQAYRLNFGSRSGAADYFFYASRLKENGFRENSDGTQNNIGGNLGYSFGKAGKIIFDMSSHETHTGVPGSTSILSPLARQDVQTQNVRASYLLPIGPHDLALRLFATQREVTYLNPDSNPFNASNSFRQEARRGAELQGNYVLANDVSMLVGGSYIRDREDSSDRLTTSSSFIEHFENKAAFVVLTLGNDLLKVIPTLRYDNYPNRNQPDFWSPRIQVVSNIIPEHLRLSVSAAKSLRMPNIDDLFYTSTFYNGNPNLKPEEAESVDAGFELYNRSMSLRANAFKSQIKNLIQTTLAFDTVENVGKSRRQGFEVEIAQQVSTLLDQRVNYTYLHNRGIPNGFSDYVELSYSPRHTVNYTLTLKPTPRLSMDSGLRYVDKRFSGNNLGGTRMPSHVLWDLRTGYKVLQAELYVGVQNVLNKRYIEVPGYPLPGRTYYGGVTLKLWD